MANREVTARITISDGPDKPSEACRMVYDKAMSVAEVTMSGEVAVSALRVALDAARTAADIRGDAEQW